MITNIGVYQIRSKRTNKFYIGSSSNLDKRKKAHFRVLRKGGHHNKLLQQHYDKYGEQDLQFIVLKYFRSRKRALKLEDQLIRKYCTNKRCFNLGMQASGGDNLSLNPDRNEILERRSNTVRYNMSKMTDQQRKQKYGRPGAKNGMYGRTHTAETRAKLSKANKGKHYNLGIKKSEEAKAKYRAIAQARVASPDYVNPFKGKHHSKKTKAFLSMKMRQRIADGYLPPNARKVKINNTVYNSLNEAGRAIGCGAPLILYRIKSKNYPDYNYA